MRIRETRVLHHAMPFRAWPHRVAFGLFVVAALALIILSRVDPQLAGNLRQSVTDIFAPAVAVLNEPVATADSAIAEIRTWVALREQNASLQEANRRLLHWREAALRLEQENNQLRDLLLTGREPLQSFVTARAVGDPGGPFVRTLILRAGVDSGISAGDPVLGENGLVGRLITVGRTSSRVLLLTDLNSRVPVLIAGSRVRGILSGDNSASPRIAFLPQSAEVAVGDRVLTSGDGGMFPPGLVVGTVSAIEENGVRVTLASDVARQEFLRVLNFTPPVVEPIPRPDLAGPMNLLGPIWAAAERSAAERAEAVVPLPQERPESAAGRGGAR